MVDVSKVQQWVQKAVADIAAFDGNLRKADKDSETKALSSLLAGPNLTQDDKNYIEGFMLDKNAKAVKINGLKPKKNESKMVELPYGEPFTFDKANEESLNQLKSMYNTVRLFFDEEGNVVTNEIRGKDGNTTYASNIKRISDKEVEISTEQKMIDGSVIKSKGISNGERDFEKAEYKPIEMVITKGDSTIQEQKTDSDGVTLKKTYMHAKNKSFYIGVPLPSTSDMGNMSPEEFIKQVAVVEETYKNGVVNIRYINDNGEVIMSREGRYTQDRFGSFNTQFPVG